MNYPKASQYDSKFINDNMMGPNAMKVLEELLGMMTQPKNAVVLDLGCGAGLTSIFMAKEYGWQVMAADLWIDPTDNYKRFKSFNLTPKEVMPIRAEAHALPFAHEFFDLVVSVDAYQYFGCEEGYMERHLLPLVKPGGHLLIAVPGVRYEVEEGIPQAMTEVWDEEDLTSFKTVSYWQGLLEQVEGIASVEVSEMISFDEVWQDWLECDNEHAVGDREAFECGASSYMNFIAMIIRKKS